MVLPYKIKLTNKNNVEVEVPTIAPKKEKGKRFLTRVNRFI